MQRREERSEGAWEQRERRTDPVVNRVGRGGKSVWLLLVLSSWWGNMSLTPRLLLCTENITANMRVVKTGGENLIWNMYIMDCCALWASNLLSVSTLNARTYAGIHISYMDTYVCGSNGNHVCKCVCVCERHKIWTQLPLLITTRMCPSSFESRLFAVPLQMLSARTQALPQDGRSESAVTSRTSEESKSLSLSDRRIY